ncbi:MAG: alpha-galactosidase, partial [Chthoniobacteraceae bacterium]|nr:alpha-galactosidase [Chthoniobacteraceae bacterium]
MTKKLAFALAITTLSIIGARAGEDWVRFSQDGSQILVEAPGVSKMQGATHAVFSMDGKYNYVISKDSLVDPIKQSTASTPFGEAVVSTATYGVKGSPFQYTVTLKRLKKIHAFTLQGVFHNRSDKNVKLEAFDLLDTLKSAGGALAVENASDWLVTPLMQDDEAEDLSKMKKTFRDAVIVYHANGQGFLVGPVGPAEAYTSVEFANGEFNSRSEMEGVLVRAGESRRSEEVVYCFEPSRTATDIWTRWVAITHKARTKRGPVYGWCSWYDRTTKIDEAHILNVADILAKNPNVFGKGILQIDDGYQKMDGDWSANAKFPSGLAAVTKKIRNVGWIPGVWFAPLMMNPEHPWMKAHPDAIQTNALGIKNFMNANWFHPDGANWLVPDHPESKKFLAKIISDAHENGFGYIK